MNIIKLEQYSKLKAIGCTKMSQDGEVRGTIANCGIIHRDIKPENIIIVICMLNFLIAIVSEYEFTKLQQSLEPLGLAV